MADFTFSFTHHEDFDNLLTDFGVDVDGLQSDSDTVPDDTVEDEQVYTQSRRSSWEPEDEAIHSVPELSHTEPLHTESSHTEPSHPTLHPAAEEFHSRFWYKDYSTNRSSSLTARTCLDLSRSAQSADEYFLGKEVDPSRELAPPYLQSPTGDNYQGCDDCETKGPNRSYCNVCSLSFCESCWNRNPCHRITHPGIPHEKTPRSLAQKTDAVFDPDIKDGPEREELHCKDVLTSWFGINREDCARPLLQDYGRFEYLMASMGRTSENGFSHLDTSARYPSFVSFVGQTGAGKSSLIKLIIDLGAKTNEQFDTPVVSAKGNTYPTSSDVHLYMDPPTSKSDHPILYADCEGLEGGEREPVAELVKKRATQADSGASDRYDQPISERDIIWADEPWRRSRAFAVKELYPRLLYTFSDVIVFVLKNSKQVSSLTVESVLVSLVEWAAAALEGSSNQPVLPHAIIALNASENGIPAQLWDVDVATESLMREMSQTAFKNCTLRKYVEFWHDRKRRIKTVEDLLLSYYTSIKITELTTNIRWACQASGRRRSDLRVLLNVEYTQAYLQDAFNHFSKSIESPFDFVQASFTHSPIPDDFGGNILKLAVQLMEAWKDRATPRSIFEELSAMIASCIMLDATRHSKLGTAIDIVPSYFEHLDNALMNFCDRYWPCEYVRPGKGRCVNVRSGHTKGHQSASGRVLAGGAYESSFTFDSFQKHFHNEVYLFLDQLLRDLPRNNSSDGKPEVKAATNQHKTKILRPFFSHVLEGNETYEFSSHTVCLCCLLDVPEHSLPCGHVLCTRCLRAYGTVTKEHNVEFLECPIDGKVLDCALFRLKPDDCGVRILTLDGGGVRGIAELEILRQIEYALGNGLRIQDFLDFVVGTSTGGIIALGLAVKGWSVEECTQKFESLCFKAFQERMLANAPLVGRVIRAFKHSHYETDAIEGALTEAFTEDASLFGGAAQDTGMPRIKVAVTAAAVSTSAVLSNYNRFPETSLPYHFERPEKASAELRVWEAARATSAAPLYFTPFSHPNSKQIYFDGGVYHNNPINIAERERKLIWPETKAPDVVISIGTGHNLNRRKSKKPYKPAATKGIISQGMFLAQLARDHIEVSLNSAQTWKDFINTKKSDEWSHYVRLDTAFSTDPPELDDLSKLEKLRDMAREQFADSSEISLLAHRLVASSFYFQPDAIDPLRRKEVTGHIYCRLPDNDPRISALGKFIFEKAGVAGEACFRISEHGQFRSHTHVELGPDVLGRMIHNCRFGLKQIRIPVSNELHKTCVELQFAPGQSSPISGFPRCLVPSRRLNNGPRRALTSTETARWAVQTTSQRRKPTKWTPYANDRGNVLVHFGNKDHILGNATIRGMASEREYLAESINSCVPYPGPQLINPVDGYWPSFHADAPMLRPLHLEATEEWDYHWAESITNNPVSQPNSELTNATGTSSIPTDTNLYELDGTPLLAELLG